MHEVCCMPACLIKAIFEHLQEPPPKGEKSTTAKLQENAG